jgi:type IV pilus assembly protein PilP
MARKSDSTKVKKFLTIGGILAVIQVVVLVFMSPSEQPQQAKDAIENAVDKVTDPRKREQARIIAALIQYRNSKGKLPDKLEDLVPDLLDRIPTDSETSRPFTYQVDGGKFYVGTGKVIGGDKGAAPREQAKDKPGTFFLSDSEIDQLIASLDAEDAEPVFVYDSANKRDPFIPFDFSRQVKVDPTKSPLERYTLGQLKLTAVLLGGADPKAMVETMEGKGYTVKKGSKIGPDNGVVVEILQDKLLILESSTDFTGATKNRTVELQIRTKDSEDAPAEASRKKR